jgi:hypothetical protein
MATQPENNDKAEEKISKDGLSEKQLAPRGAAPHNDFEKRPISYPSVGRG